MIPNSSPVLNSAQASIASSSSRAGDAASIKVASGPSVTSPLTSPGTAAVATFSLAEPMSTTDSKASAGASAPTALLLTGGMGNTHRVHMEVIQEQLQHQYPQLNVVKKDIKITGIVRNAELQQAYDAECANATLREERWKEKQQSPVMQDRIKALTALIQKEQPDVIFGNYDVIIRQVMDIYETQPNMGRPPVIQHLSDLGPMHPNWVPKQFLKPNSSDRVLTMGKAVAPGRSDQQKFVLERGVPPERITHVGAPVRQAFKNAAKLSRDECRDKLRKEHGVHVPADKTSILLMSGSGYWPEKLIDTTKALAESNLGPVLHIKVIAGVSEKARAELSGIADEVFDYIDGDKLALLLKAVDVPCIKAGGGAIPDMIQMKKPFVISQALPGPEPENALFVKEQGIGKVALETDELLATITDLRNHPEQFTEMEEAQVPHIVDDSAERIASIIYKSAIEHFSETSEK